MSKRSKMIEQPEEFEEEQNDTNEEPDEILKSPVLRTCVSCGSSANLFKTKVHKSCIECLNLRPKKTEKQLEAFKKTREVRQANIERRKREVEELEKQAKDELDKKIVSKAISIKKKMIKQNAQLEEISDDDTPLEEVIRIAKKKPAKTQTISKPKPVRRATNVVEVVEDDVADTYENSHVYPPQVPTFRFL